MDGDRIALELPALPAYERVASIAAANVAQHQGFTRSRIDDLVRALTGAIDVLLRCAVAEDRLLVTYRADDGELVVRAELTSTDGPGLPADQASALADVVDELVDGCTIAERSLELELRPRRAA